ncbi:MAG: HD domain-containing protein [Acidilobaceae archaeon]|nr:HD domain-containing protein [Acidilobaceae archaeon]
MATELMGAYEHRTIVQDAVHGVIPLNAKEYELLQTPFLRRIHEVKQLGLAHLVFPSATHSRLDHSLGVMHLAWRMAKKAVEAAVRSSEVCAALFKSCDNSSYSSFLQVARLAGLLHDIGHMPFSHMGEDSIEAIATYKLQRRREEYGKFHELYTNAFMRALEERHGKGDLALYLEAARSALFSNDWDVAEKIRLKREALALVRRIMSDYIVDADRLDYLVRDARFSGIVYGYIDIDRMVESLEVRAEVTGGGRRASMEISQKALQAVEDMFDARYKMYKTLYFHHKLGGIKVAVNRVFWLIQEKWSYVRPPGAPDGFEELLDPLKLAELIADGTFYFDDNDAMSMIKALGVRGGREGKRWASALLHDRSLLPISLIKRPEEIASKVESWGPKVGEELVKIVQGDAFEGIWDRSLKRVMGERAEVSVEKDVQRIYERSAGDAESSLYTERSLYVRSLMDVASAPLVFVYAFSEDEGVHRRLYDRRQELRRAFQEELVEELKRALRA